MSLSQFDKWFRSVGCEPAEALPAPPELRHRKGYYLPVTGEAKPASDRQDGALAKRVVLTTPALDRQGDVIVPTGARLRWFKKNPVVLWAHRYDHPPIGSVDTSSIIVTDKGIEAVVLFDAGTAAGREVHGLYDRGVMRAWSVGFVPLKWKVVEDEKTGKVRGYRVEEWELLELSAVPVPANPEALTRSLREIEERACDPALLPVLKGIKAAVEPPPGPGKGSDAAPRIAERLQDLDRRLSALEAAESSRKTAADRERLRAKGHAAAVADAVSARLPQAVQRLVADEIGRRRGTVSGEW